MTRRTVPEDDRGGLPASEPGECLWCHQECDRVDVEFEAYVHYDCVPRMRTTYRHLLNLIFPQENK